MQASQSPTLVPLAFAANGTKNTIPEASQISVTPGAASLNDGFPPLTFTPVAAGGTPPTGADFNGVLNLITQSIRWAHGGGRYAFSSTFAADANVTGYPAGAELMSADQQGTWLSLNDSNTDNPDTGAGTKWVPSRAYGATSLTGLTNANITLTPAQAAKTRITLAGTLTGNVQIIFPTWTKDWVVVNNTTGAFTVTCKTPAGTGIAVTQGGMAARLYGDGTNITQLSEQLAPASNPLAGQFLNLTATFANAVSNTIAIDQVAVADALGGNVSTISNWNSTIATNVTGIGGMDTGTVTGLANVAIFAAWNPTTGAKSFFGQNVTAAVARVGSVYSGANLPAGYTRTCLVAVVLTDSTGKFFACNLLDRHCTINVTNQSSGQSPASNVVLQLGCPINARTVDVYVTFTSTSVTNANIAISGQPSGNMPVYSAQVQSGQSGGLQLLGFVLTTLRTIYWTYSNSAGTPAFIIALNGWSI